MPYVYRNKEGKICAVSQEKFEQCDEWIEENEPELNDFINLLHHKKELIEQTDLNFVRVLEDVIDLMIAKNIVMLTELPSAAQKKIAERQHLRKALSPRLDLLGDEQEENLF